MASNVHVNFTTENSEIRPPQSVDVRIDAYGTNFDEQLHLEHVTATILWEPPEDIGSFRFAGYFVTFSNSRLPEEKVTSFPVNMNTTSARIAVLFGENIFMVQTRDACGDMSQPMNMTMDIKRKLYRSVLAHFLYNFFHSGRDSQGTYKYIYATLNAKLIYNYATVHVHRLY